MRPSAKASSRDAQHARLVELASTTPWFKTALSAVRDLQLPSWCIGAGAVRTLVWDFLHEYSTPSRLSDIDVAYFDPSLLSEDQDEAFQNLLSAARPDLPWEVTNQAALHLRHGGHATRLAKPLLSLDEAVASWPEFATSVGIRLEDDDSFTVISPHGLDDLFSMVIRHNPTMSSAETYRQRVQQKRYPERWPQVLIVPA